MEILLLAAAIGSTVFCGSVAVAAYGDRKYIEALIYLGGAVAFTIFSVGVLFS